MSPCGEGDGEDDGGSVRTVVRRCWLKPDDPPRVETALAS